MDMICRDADTEELFEDASQLPIGVVVMAEGFCYEDAMTAIDVGDIRMDRGMLSVPFNSEEYWIQEFWQNILSGRILAYNADIPEEALYQSLFVLEIQWLSNQGSFADTLATCMPLHQISLYSSDSLKSFMCLQIELCELIAHLVGSAAVASVNEDFSINLYGIPCRNRLALKGSKVSIDSLQDNPYHRRLRLWKQFWEIITGIIGNSSNVPDEIMRAKNIIIELSLKNPAVNESYSFIKPDSIGIFPIMSNVFGSGCPRRPIPKMSIHEAWERWDSILQDLLRVFSFVSLLSDPTKGTNMEKDKNERLAETETFKGIILLQGLEGISAIPRSIIFTILLSALRQTANDACLDVIQILCHSHARQHCLIPKFMKKYIDSPQVDHFIVPLAIWHVLLGFKLDLYNQQEVFEALWIILKLSEYSSLNEFSGQVSAILQSSEDSMGSAGSISAYDDCRFMNRWECSLGILHSLNQAHLHISSQDCSKYIQCMNDRGSKSWRFPSNFHLWKELFKAFLSNVL